MEKFIVTINADPDDGSITLTVDGKRIGVKLVCYHDEDGSQIIDVLESSPLQNREWRLAFIADGLPTKVYSLDGMGNDKIELEIAEALKSGE